MDTTSRPTSENQHQEPHINVAKLLLNRGKRFLLNHAVFMVVAAVFEIALGYFGQHASSLPPQALVIIWLVATSCLAVAMTYPYIVKKHNAKEMFNDGTKASSFINGRLVRVIVSFLFSALLLATLMIATQKWGTAQWIFAVLGIPVYCVVSDLLTKREIQPLYKDFYQTRGSMLWAWIGTGIVLTILFALAGFASVPKDHISLGAAFSQVPLLFAGSSSPLLEKIGRIGYLIDGYTRYTISWWFAGDAFIYLIISLALCFSTALSLSQFLSLFMLITSKPTELLLVFRPIEEKDSTRIKIKSALQPIGAIVASSIALFLCFTVANEHVSDIRDSNLHSTTMLFIKEQSNLVVYDADGKKYDQEAVDSACESALESSAGYEEIKSSLVTSINEYYDTCEANVDGYLDWYYGLLPSLQRLIFGENHDEMLTKYREDLVSKERQGELDASIRSYNAVIADVKKQTLENLSKQDACTVPGWLISEQYAIEQYFSISEIEPLAELELPQGDYSNRDTYRSEVLNSLETSRQALLEKVK